MNIFLYNSDLKITGIVDAFESFIWTERYSSYGDFELLMRMSSENINLFLDAKYLGHGLSERLMVIETIEIKTDVESGSSLFISGRSIESLLERRIVWSQTTLSGNLQDELARVFQENIINPQDQERKIESFVFEESNDSAITELLIDAQFTGDDLYSVTSAICEAYGIGFKVILSAQGTFVFSLYSGTDRSFNQTENPHVIFSPKFDNLINSDFVQDYKNNKTVALVAGEGEGVERITKVVTNGDESATGINRYELYVDARDISSSTMEGDLTPEMYLSLLEERGSEELVKKSIEIRFSGQFDTTKTFIYGTDFFMGDLVQVENEYGITAISRVVELIFSEDSYGFFAYPTFSAFIL